MKKVILTIISICFTIIYVSAQKSKVQTAYNYYKEPYQQYDKAKEAIDEAILHEQSKDMAKTWYYRGMIYMSLYESEKYGHLCNNCLMTAYESFQKMNELDHSNEWADEVKLYRAPYVMNKIFSEGVEKFKKQDYAGALTIFEVVQKMSPGDTSAILNSAYAAERAGQTQKGIKYYQQLIDMGYQDEKVYLALSNLHKLDNNLDLALTSARNGQKVFPESINLMLTEINILLSSGKNEEATTALDAAIKRDPNNASLYLALGSTFDNLANPKDAAGKDLAKPAQFADYMKRAESSYLAGLKIAPENYELNYNLGAMYFNQAAEMANAANKITNNDQYEKAKKLFEQKFAEAKPYLEQALKFNPQKSVEDKALYKGTLNSLKQLYARTGEMEKYNEVKKLLEEK